MLIKWLGEVLFGFSHGDVEFGLGGLGWFLLDGHAVLVEEFLLAEALVQTLSRNVLNDFQLFLSFFDIISILS